MSMIMISHDLGVIAHLCDRVIVMYLGKVVEEGRFVDVYDDPLHPYTRALLESIPRIGERSRRRLKAIAGAVPDPYTRPAGCYFEPRCEQAQHDRCEVRQPSHSLPPAAARCAAYCTATASAGMAEAATNGAGASRAPAGGGGSQDPLSRARGTVPQRVGPASRRSTA